MNLEFSGDLFHWAGPAPFFFVAVPEYLCEDLQAASKFVSYGWGMIPVSARIGRTEWRTSLFPKEGLYLVPIKASVRNAQRLNEGDQVILQMKVGR